MDDECARGILSGVDVGWLLAVCPSSLGIFELRREPGLQPENAKPPEEPPLFGRAPSDRPLECCPETDRGMSGGQVR